MGDFPFDHTFCGTRTWYQYQYMYMYCQKKKNKGRSNSLPRLAIAVLLYINLSTQPPPIKLPVMQRSNDTSGGGRMFHLSG